MQKYNVTKQPLYSVWAGIKSRCNNKNAPGYKYYGKRGIKVCKEWLSDSKAFIKWGEANGYKKGLQINRIDNDGNYTPGNCNFVTPGENFRNNRQTKLTWKDVGEIRCARIAFPDIKTREIAGFYNCGTDAITAIIHNRCWVTDRPEYI